MKTRLCIIVPLLLFAAIEVLAQSNPNEYRNLAAMHLWTQNCEKAQKCYNIFKELSGNPLEKMDVLVGQQCKGESYDNYVIIYDWPVLMKYLETINHPDIPLILRVLSLYSDPQERAKQLRNVEHVFEPIARGLDGDAWYESISVQKKL